MGVYFTSDLHFGHNQPFIYKARGFSSIEEHDAILIERWNKIIKPTDQVIILGDLMLNNNEHGIQCLTALNGFKSFTKGNHDSDKRIGLYQNNGILYRGRADGFKYKKLEFQFGHFPTITSNNEKNIWHTILSLYGHTHQQTNFYEDHWFVYHVGVDSHDCTPVSIDQIIEDCKTKVNR